MAHFRVQAKLEAFSSGGPVVPSPGGDLLACAFKDEVKIVSAATGRVTTRLPGDTTAVTALAFGAGGEVLFTAARSLQLQCWALASGQCLRTWKGHSAPVVHLAARPAGDLVASGSADRTVRVWDAKAYHCTHVLRGHSAVVLQLAFQPGEWRLISAAEDGEIRVWDLLSSSCTATLQGHFSAVTALSIAPDNWTLLSAGRDKVAILWDLHSNTKMTAIPTFEAIEGAEVVTLQADNRAERRSGKVAKAAAGMLCFATAGEKGAVKVWSGTSGRCIAELAPAATSHEGSQLTSLASVGSDGTVMTTSVDAHIAFFRIQSAASQSADAAPLCSVELEREMVGDQGDITDLRLMGPAETPTHLAVASSSADVTVYSLATGCTAAVMRGHSDAVLALDFAPVSGADGVLVSGSKDATVRLWRVQMADLPAAARALAEAAAARCTCLASIRGHAAAVTAVALGQKSPGSFLLSASTDKLLKLWDTSALVASGSAGPGAMQSQATVQAHENDINSLSLSPNEAVACTTSQDRTAKVWKLPSLVLLHTLRGHKRGVWSAAFSPVEQTVATSSGDKTVKLWSLRDGSCLRTLQGHNASVLRVLFIAAGMQLVSGAADGLVKVWNINASECTATYEEHEGKVWALTGNGPAYSVLASGGSDATVCVWNDASEEQREEVARAKQATLAAQQELANALQSGELVRAAALAFSSNQPGQLLTVIERVQSEGATQQLASVVSTLSAEQAKSALTILRDWNTNSRYAQAAQTLLHAFLTSHSPQALKEISGIDDILTSLVPYTERHAAHVERLQNSCFILDYTLAQLRHVSPQANAS